MATVHRPSNADEPERIETVLRALNAVAAEMPVVLSLRPRTRRSVGASGVGALLDSLIAIEPVGYLDMIVLIDGARGVLTDSGVIQEETTALRIPCLTVRQNTECPVTVERGTNRLTPRSLTVQGVRNSLPEAVGNRGGRGKTRPEGWNGRAAERLVEAHETYRARKSPT